MFLKRLFAILVFASLSLSPAAAKGPTVLTISAAEGLFKGPYTGRIYVVFASHRDDRDPVDQIEGASEIQMAVHEVHDWDGKSPIRFPDDALAFPETLSSIRAGSYKVQAFLDCSGLPDCRRGGLVSAPKVRRVSLRDGTWIKLELDQARSVPDVVVPEAISTK